MSRAEFMVLDASAAAELVLNDPGARPVADALRDAVSCGMRIVGPSALLSEVQSVVSRRVRRNALDAEGGRLCSDFWRSLITRIPLEIGAENDHHAASFAMSLAYGHSYYECLYLSLARMRGAELLTCDPALARKASAGGIAYFLPNMALV